ncbi:MAG TPA: polysaccharide pyruvyl transferase family protein [Thermoanaerobaculia bacterium]
MRIAHIFPKYDANTGDHFVQHGILKLLRERLGDFEYRPLSNKKDAPAGEPIGITTDSLPIINGSDLLVIGGSNLYEVSGDRWSVVVEDAALDALAVPVLPIGIGSGWSFAFPQFPSMPERVAEQVRRLHARARGSSVRDDLTARVLARHGIERVTVTGCPAGFLGEEPLRPVGRGLVGVPFLPRRMFSPASWMPAKARNPTHRRRRTMTKFFLGLLAALRAERLETRVLVHDAADLPLARQLLGTAFFYDADAARMLDAIRECDVIVGFRLHSGIAGLGFGIPPIPVLADGRNYGFAETLGLLELSVPVDPGSVGMAMERVRLALGSGRSAWSTAVSRRDALARTMRHFLEGAL